MTCSIAVGGNISCDQCGHTFDFRMWCVVNTVDSPELYSRILKGNIHELICDNCHHIISLNSPLLIFRPDKKRNFLFSPVKGTNNLDEQQKQLQSVIGVMRQYLGSKFNEDWFIDGFVIVAREKLPSLLKKGDDNILRVQPAELLKLYQQLIIAEPWDGTREIVEKNPSILNDEMLKLIQQAIQLCQELGDETGVYLNRQYLNLLKSCREIGIKQAFLKKMNEREYELTPEIEPLYEEFQSSPVERNFGRLIHLGDQLLKKIPKEVDPFYWGMINVRLANILFVKYNSLEAEQYLESAIIYCNNALEVFSLDEWPKKWANIQSILGGIYKERIRGSKADNQDRAIDHFNNSLKVFHKDTSPEEWAGIQINLGNTYIERINGKKSANVEKAILLYLESLPILKTQEHLKSWANTKNNLIFAYISQKEKNLSENIKELIRHGTELLNAITKDHFGDIWAMTHTNMGIAYSECIDGDRSQNYELAIDHLSKAAEFYYQSGNLQQWSKVANNLAQIYIFRIKGVRFENLEKSINLLERVLDVCTPSNEPLAWATAHFALAIVYSEHVGKKLEPNPNKAIKHYSKALEVLTKQDHPFMWASIQSNLSSFYSVNLRGKKSIDSDRGINHGQLALEVFTREEYPIHWAGVQHNLGVAYATRQKGIKLENIENSIRYHELALEVRTKENFPDYWAVTQQSLAGAYVRRVKGNKTENIKRAINHYQMALSVFTIDKYPLQYRDLYMTIGDQFHSIEEWNDANIAYEEATKANELLMEIAFTEFERRALINNMTQVHSSSCYALMRMKRYKEALLRFEKGKAQVMADVFARDLMDLKGIPAELREDIQNTISELGQLEAIHRFPRESPYRHDELQIMQRIKEAHTSLGNHLQKLRQFKTDPVNESNNIDAILGLIPSKGAFVIPVMTENGTAIFVIPHGTEAIEGKHIIWLDKFKAVPDFNKIIAGSIDGELKGGWVGSYLDQQSNLKGWMDKIDSTSSVLWDIFVSPIYIYLKKFGVELGSHVIFFPQGSLGLLPLHAAWRRVEGKKRTFIDDYVVSYIPSIQVLRTCFNRVKEMKRQNKSLLAVVNPTEDLRFSDKEGEIITYLFSPLSSECLNRKKATRGSVLKRASGKGYLHFCSHAYYSWHDPFKSGIFLKNGPLYLAEIMSNIDLSFSRLVCLSACETGLADFRSNTDEFLGLSSGFLQAGAPGIISSLWKVEDLATTLLMGRFYFSHLKLNMEPAHALRDAQLWLSNSKKNDIIQFLKSSFPLNQSRIKDILDLLQEGNPYEKPFEKPFFWAAFILTGL